MESLTLEAKKRAKSTKGETNRLRKTGYIPSILYGRETQPIAVDQHSFDKVFSLAGGHSLIAMNVEGESSPHKVLVKEYTLDKISREFLHIDFFEVEDDKPVKTHIPIVLVGTPAGVRTGGILEKNLRDVCVKCLPTNIPDKIEIDVRALVTGQNVRLASITYPDGVTLADDGAKVVCAVVKKGGKKKAGEEEGEESEKA